MSDHNLEELYKAKSHLIFRYLLKIGCSREDAEDIIQNTFYKAISNMIHLEIENPSAWLFKVATHNYYDLCRKQKRHPLVKIQDEFIEEILSFAEDGEELIIRKENRADIQKVINQLKPAQANLLLLKYEMNLSYEQIANLLNLKIDTVRTTLYRARNQFKKKWRETHE
ncbi:hypothetical protein EP18_14785 [Lysinibacillus sphaericus]|nr:RNA polymerase sigma factor [Lysinibacillus sphaericus]KEK10910.1 hypothetical protein EP18_14785 [Lysinibacillus sphaericus]